MSARDVTRSDVSGAELGARARSVRQLDRRVEHTGEVGGAERAPSSSTGR